MTHKRDLEHDLRVRVISAASLDVALTAWGEHERQTRSGQLPPGADSWPPALVARRFRAPYVRRIEQVAPIGTLLVELDPHDLGRLRICTTGATLAEWRIRPHQEPWIQHLCESEQVVGPLLVLQHSPNGSAQDSGDLVLKDGFHRAEAWRRHVANGASYPISAYLVLTKHAPIIG